MFDYFKKADIKKTNFDMSNHCPYTANLGEILPTYNDAALAGDEWKMSLAETIKTAPFVAPSLVKMSNNNYAFFTPNQTIWEHWNDFITNGSMIQDTVLSASNKTEVDSVYKWPSIPANLLQIPLKVANGYACPVFAVGYQSTALGVTRDTDTAVLKLSENEVSDLRSSFSCFELETTSKNKVAYFPYSPALHHRLLTIADAYTKSGLVGFDGASIHNKIRWFMFADEVSSEISLNNPPVSVTWEDVLHFEVVNGEYCNPYFVKHPSYSIDPDWLTSRIVTSAPVYSKETTWSENFFVSKDEIANVTIILSVGSKTKTKKLSKSQLDNALEFVETSGWHFNFNALYSSDAAFEHWFNSALLNEDLSYVSVLVNTPTDTLTTSSNVRVISGTYTASYLPSHIVCINPYKLSSEVGNTYFECPVSIEASMSVSNTEFLALLDPDPSMTHNVLFDQNGKSLIAFADPEHSREHLSECYACGYSPLGFWHYCCQKVSRLVEYMDINIDGLVCRSFVPYLTTDYNALPFMAYSKIWNDYFRNSVVQSPELCYKDVNGCLFNNFQHNACINCYSDVEAISDEETNYYFVPQSQGWVLPVHNKPLEFTAGEMCVIKIDTLTKALSLITGCNISSLFPFDVESSDAVFLPSYYNALCAVKYKNIGRSIYTSGMLEPTNGAKIEEIPDTVIELRSASALQKFWEKTAVARSVKKWYQTIFGSTPSHDDYDSPLLLGKASSEIQVGEILQQSQTSDTSALGERAGVALGGCKKGIASHYFNEHGTIMILSCVTMDISFVDGELPYTKALHSYLDLPYEQFAHIGNEGLPVSALSSVTPPRYHDNQISFTALPWSSPRGASMAYGNRSSLLGNAAIHHGDRVVVPNGTLNSWISDDLPLDSDGNINTADYLSTPFSYTSRYAQWKIKLDGCKGEFRRDMSHWVPSQRLLGAVAFTHFFCTWEFRGRNFDLDRYFAYADGDKFYVDRYNKCSVIRALPFASTPQ